DFATLRLCDFATLRLCDFATLRLCDFATLRLCDFATLRLCDFATSNIIIARLMEKDFFEETVGMFGQSAPPLLTREVLAMVGG
ncbi:MAG: hypothetical protein IJV49_03020, partial [Aeriscardovia sp.]|nr:hypothetical protein [Aeriscardovia sp.]